VEFNPGKAFEFEFEVEISPTIKATGYKGLKITREHKKVGDDDVKRPSRKLANMNARLVESKADTLSPTHFAVINYEGFLDDKPITGAKRKISCSTWARPQAISGLARV